MSAVSSCAAAGAASASVARSASANRENMIPLLLEDRSESKIRSECKAAEAHVVDQLVVPALAVIEVTVVEDDVAPLEGVAHAEHPLPGEEGRGATDVGVVIDEPLACAELRPPLRPDDGGPDVFGLLGAPLAGEGRSRTPRAGTRDRGVELPARLRVQIQVAEAPEHVQVRPRLLDRRVAA